MRPLPSGRLSLLVRLFSVGTSLVGLWLSALFVVPRLGLAERRRLGVRLAARMLDALRLAMVVRGSPLKSAAPCLIVANHVSWLDVYVLNATREARFVAKSETRRWPIVGTIAARFDAIFIVRGSFRDAGRVKDRVAAALRAGETVVVFPEGTTTDGTRLRRFHPAILQAAIDAHVAIQPVAIRYPDADGGPNPAAAFVDDMTFADSLGRVLRHPRMAVELVVGPRIPPRGRTRRELAALARRHIADALVPGGCVVEAELPRRRRPPRVQRRLVGSAVGSP